MSYALDFSKVETLKNLIQKDLIAVASLVDYSGFDDLGWDVQLEVENESTEFHYMLNSALACKYDPAAGITRTGKVGKVVESKLKTELFAATAQDNILNYREKEPISTIGVMENGVLNTPHSQFLMSNMAKVVANQVMYNLVGGNRSFDGTENKPLAYSLFDGLFTHITKGVTAETISTGNGNLQIMDAITFNDSDEAKVAAYEMFDKFVLNMDEDLADADDVRVMTSVKLAQYITQGAALKFKSHVQQVIMDSNNGVQFFDRKNIHLVPKKIMGTGQTMVAYQPGVIRYGTNLKNIGDPQSANVQVAKDSKDQNQLNYQFTLGGGTCIRFVDSSLFCVAAKQNNNNLVLNTLKTLKDGSEAIVDANAAAIEALAERVAALEQ